MFLNYDLLAKRWVPYGKVYPFAEFGAGALMVAGVADLAVGAGRAVHRRHRRGFGLQGRLSRQARAEVRLRRRRQQCAAWASCP